MSRQLYTVSMDLYRWFDRQFDDVDIQVTGYADLAADHVYENVEITEVKVKDELSLAFLKARFTDLAALENEVREILRNNPYDFVEAVAENLTEDEYVKATTE